MEHWTINELSGNEDKEITGWKQEEKTEEQYVKVTCLDVNGNSIGEIYLLVSELKPGESISATANIADDYINLYDYEISK